MELEDRRSSNLVCCLLWCFRPFGLFSRILPCWFLRRVLEGSPSLLVVLIPSMTPPGGRFEYLTSSRVCPSSSFFTASTKTARGRSHKASRGLTFARMWPKQTPKHVLAKCPKPQNASCASFPRQVSAEREKSHADRTSRTESNEGLRFGPKPL